MLLGDDVEKPLMETIVAAPKSHRITVSLTRAHASEGNGKLRTPITAFAKSPRLAQGSSIFSKIG